jgi:hypothetical protein
MDEHGEHSDVLMRTGRALALRPDHTVIVEIGRFAPIADLNGEPPSGSPTTQSKHDRFPASDRAAAAARRLSDRHERHGLAGSAAFQHDRVARDSRTLR